MTGQVKEDLIARAAELGVRIRAGRLAFVPPMVSRDDLVEHATGARIGGASVDVPAGSLAFSVAGVPVVLRPAQALRAVLTLNDGTEEQLPEARLSVGRTSDVFERRGVIRRIDVFAPLSPAS